RAGLVDVARRAHADGLDPVPRGELGDQRLDRLLDLLGVGGRRLDAELLDDGTALVDDTAEDLGAADVDADGQGHGRSSSGSSGSSASRSMCCTRESARDSALPAAASSPAAACRKVDAAEASWALTSGLAP